MSQVLYCLGIFTDRLCSAPETKAQDPRCRTRPIVALTPQPDTLSVRSTDRAGQQSVAPGSRSGSAPQLGSEGSVLIAAIPPPRGPHESTFLPLLLKWIRPLPANLNADRSISIVPRGSGAHAHPSPGDRDHPPLRAAASRRHSEGGGRRGTQGRG